MVISYIKKETGEYIDPSRLSPQFKSRYAGKCKHSGLEILRGDYCAYLDDKIVLMGWFFDVYEALQEYECLPHCVICRKEMQHDRCYHCLRNN